jgi:drug/metabolite transporter (DMT)-like permease
MKFTHQRSDHALGAAALLGSALLYAMFGLFIRELDKMYNIGGQILAGYLVASSMMFVYIRLTKRSIEFDRRSFVRMVALGLASCISIVMFVYAVTELKLANAVFLIYAGSMLSSIPLGSAMGEAFSLRKILVLLLALGGIATFGDFDTSLSLGALAAIGCGVLMSFGNAMRKSLAEVPRHVITQIQFTTVAVASVPFAFLADSPVVHDVSLLPLITTFVYAIGRIGLTYLTLYGYKHIDVNVGTVLQSTELVFAAILGFAVLNESPTAMELSGGSLILTAAVLTALPERTSTRRRVPPEPVAIP